MKNKKTKNKINNWDLYPMQQSLTCYNVIYIAINMSSLKFAMDRIKSLL